MATLPTLPPDEQSFTVTIRDECCCCCFFCEMPYRFKDSELDDLAIGTGKYNGPNVPLELRFKTRPTFRVTMPRERAERLVCAFQERRRIRAAAAAGAPVPEAIVVERKA